MTKENENENEKEEIIDVPFNKDLSAKYFF